MWNKRLEKQTHRSVMSVAEQIARELHSNEKYLPKKIECAGYTIVIWKANDIAEFKYRISYAGKKRPFCIIWAHEYYFNAECFAATDIFCNDVDLCVLRELLIQLKVYCGETRRECRQAAESEAEAETSYKEYLLNILES